MKIIPLDDRVYIELKEAEQVRASGIIIPDTSQERPREGTVIAVGNDESLQKLVQVGDTIFFANYSAEEADDDNRFFVGRADILGKLI